MTKQMTLASPTRAARAAGSLPRSLLVLVLAVYAGLALFRLGTPDLAQDEGCYGVSALNILADHSHLAKVGEHPLSEAATKPYLYPASLAASITLLGRNTFALRVVNVIALIAASFFLYGLAFAFLRDRSLAILTFALFLLNPGTLTYARTVMAEPFVVLWGCCALFAAAKFREEGRWAWAVICGASLGLGFLSKLWLVLPLGLGCFVLFAAGFLDRQIKRTVLALAVVGFSFVLISSSHLLLVLWLTPHDLPHWLRIYFGVSFATRLAGPGYDPALWYRPWWFYPASFFKASFFAFPMLVLGVHALAKRRDWVLLCLVAALLLPLPGLSLFRVKETAYLFPVFPGLAFLLALGSMYWFRDAGQRELVLASLVSMAVAALFFKTGIFAPRELAMIETLYLLYLTAGLASPRFSVRAKGLAALGLASSMLFAGLMVVRTSLRHRTYYREIASYFRPVLQSLQGPLGTTVDRPYQDAASALSPLGPNIVFTAPEFASFEFFIFRSGEYWNTYYFHKTLAAFVEELRSGRQMFYVVDPSGTLYGSRISQEKIEALRRYAVDVTPEIEHSIGHRIPLEVFVPVTWTAAANLGGGQTGSLGR